MSKPSQPLISSSLRPRSAACAWSWPWLTTGSLTPTPTTSAHALSASTVNSAPADTWCMQVRLRELQLHRRGRAGRLLHRRPGVQVLPGPPVHHGQSREHNHWRGGFALSALLCWQVKACSEGSWRRCDAGVQERPHHLLLECVCCSCDLQLLLHAPSCPLACLSYLTSVVHAHDQRLLADLINEPRCDMPNCKGNVQNWIQTQSAYLKSIDSNHLVTVGAPVPQPSLLSTMQELAVCNCLEGSLRSQVPSQARICCVQVRMGSGMLPAAALRPTPAPGQAAQVCSAAADATSTASLCGYKSVPAMLAASAEADLGCVHEQDRISRPTTQLQPSTTPACTCGLTTG